MIESKLSAEEKVIGPNKKMSRKPRKKANEDNDIPFASKGTFSKFYKREYNNMLGPNSKVMKYGKEAFNMGEVVFAKHPGTGQPSLGKITANLGRGKYGVWFFKDQDTEYVNIPAQHIFQACHSVDFTQDDFVRAFFKKNNQWMKATISALDENNDVRCKIKFDNLDNEFDASFYHLKPEMCPGDSCFALWGRTGAFLPAKIEENSDQNIYMIQFKTIEKPFPARADNLIPVKSFEIDEKVYAFWARDGKYYPAYVREIVDDYIVKVQFDKLDKLFEMPTYQVRYYDNE